MSRPKIPKPDLKTTTTTTTTTTRKPPASENKNNEPARRSSIFAVEREVLQQRQGRACGVADLLHLVPRVGSVRVWRRSAGKAGGTTGGGFWRIRRAQKDQRSCLIVKDLKDREISREVLRKLHDLLLLRKP